MDSTDAQTRTTAVQRILKTPLPPRHEPEVEEAMEDYEEARARSREALMFDIRFRDGRIISFNYGLLDKSQYLPEGKIVLRFGRDEVIAEGRNLLRIYTTITEHRRRFIHEGTHAEEMLIPQDAGYIESIEIKRAQEL